MKDTERKSFLEARVQICLNISKILENPSLNLTFDGRVVDLNDSSGKYCFYIKALEDVDKTLGIYGK